MLENNYMKIDQIDLSRYCGAFSILSITQEEYDLLQIKDPYTIYSIIGSDDNRCYYGDWLMPPESIKPIYLLGPSDTYGEYTMYCNHKNSDSGDNLIWICKYDDPQKAINDLNAFNKIGSHAHWARQCYSVIASYLNLDITLHDMLIGIIVIFGYREDSRLQELIETCISYEANINQSSLPLMLIEELPHLSKSENHLYRYYSSLYDLTVYYNNFKDRKYHPKDPESLDLSKEINKIYKIFGDSTTHLRMPVFVNH